MNCINISFKALSGTSRSPKAFFGMPGRKNRKTRAARERIFILYKPVRIVYNVLTIIKRTVEP